MSCHSPLNTRPRKLLHRFVGFSPNRVRDRRPCILDNDPTDTASDHRTTPSPSIPLRNWRPPPKVTASEAERGAPFAMIRNGHFQAPGRRFGRTPVRIIEPDFRSDPNIYNFREIRATPPNSKSWEAPCRLTTPADCREIAIQPT